MAQNGVAVSAQASGGPAGGKPDQEELAVPETRFIDRMVARNEAWRRKRDPFYNQYQNNRNSGE